MAIQTQDQLSTAERDAIAQIKAWRASPEDRVHATLLQHPAQAMQSLILDSHGHVKLRFAPIAAELGVEMRTLQRAFVEEYKKTMIESQQEARLEFAKFLLSVMPPTKMSVTANLLGYDAARDFNRFFYKHVHQSPTAWSKAERQRASEKAAQLRSRAHPLSSELL